MKKGLIAISLAAAIALCGCYGSFALTKKHHDWNGTLGNKWINSCVHFVFWVIPVYGICIWVDYLVLNTIEFWTGNNPVAANIGHTDKVMGQDGKQYLVKTTRHGYKITKPDGQVANFTYNKADSTWNVDANGRKAQLMKMLNNGMVQISLNNGQKMDVTLNQQGVYQAEMAVDGNLFAAR